MIEFMVIAYPRSGTTWAANWLSTDTTLCLHDPLWKRTYQDLDTIKSKKTLGISCTGIGLFPEWLNQHPARKVILHRHVDEVNKSLAEIGLPPTAVMKLDDISGMHVYWKDIFDSPRKIYEYLLELPFDEERHTELKSMEIQPDFEGLEINKNATRKFREQVLEAIE